MNSVLDGRSCGERDILRVARTPVRAVDPGVADCLAKCIWRADKGSGATTLGDLCVDIEDSSWSQLSVMQAASCSAVERSPWLATTPAAHDSIFCVALFSSAELYEASAAAKKKKKKKKEVSEDEDRRAMPPPCSQHSLAIRRGLRTLLLSPPALDAAEELAFRTGDEHRRTLSGLLRKARARQRRARPAFHS